MLSSRDALQLLLLLDWTSTAGCGSRLCATRKASIFLESWATSEATCARSIYLHWAKRRMRIIEPFIVKKPNNTTDSLGILQKHNTCEVSGKKTSAFEHAAEDFILDLCCARGGHGFCQVIHLHLTNPLNVSIFLRVTLLAVKLETGSFALASMCGTYCRGFPRLSFALAFSLFGAWSVSRFIL